MGEARCVPNIPFCQLPVPINSVTGPMGSIISRRGATMDAFEIGEIASERERLGKRYHEFLRVPSISTGLYVLGAGQDDPQQPHSEDEVYYVVSGRATIRVAEEDRPVQPGSVVYVA